jgi:cyclase
MRQVLLAGAEKVSVNSLAVLNPNIIAEGARLFGSQCIVLGMDPVKVEKSEKFPSGYEITIEGFRKRTGLDALAWAKKAEQLGAGEIVVNSVDADGTRQGFELNLTRLIAENVGIPVVASGGGGTCQHLIDVFTKGKADAAIIASMIHTGMFTIKQIKDELITAGIPIRQKW